MDEAVALPHAVGHGVEVLVSHDLDGHIAMFLQELGEDRLAAEEKDLLDAGVDHGCSSQFVLRSCLSDDGLEGEHEVIAQPQHPYASFVFLDQLVDFLFEPFDQVPVGRDVDLRKEVQGNPLFFEVLVGAPSWLWDCHRGVRSLSGRIPVMFVSPSAKSASLKAPE